MNYMFTNDNSYSKHVYGMGKGEDTPLWRAGPEEKPVLCNACGSRWRLRGNLNGYVPKHGIRDASGNIHKLPSKMHAVEITSQQKLRAGEMPQGSDLRPTSPKGGECSISSSESSVPSPVNCMLTQGTEVCLSGDEAQWPVWYPKNVTRRKRSNLQKQPSSLIDTLHLQLYQIQQDLEDENKSEEEDILVYNKWQYIPDSDIGLGNILPKPPTAP
nr:GATA transcription factor 26-like [Ipomoea batatas]